MITTRLYFSPQNNTKKITFPSMISRGASNVIVAPEVLLYLRLREMFRFLNVFLLSYFWLMVSSLITFILEENSFKVRDLLPFDTRFGWNKCSLKVSKDTFGTNFIKVYFVTWACFIITYNKLRPFCVIGWCFFSL